MKAVFVVLSLLLALAFAEDLRLIQLKEDEEPVWATEEERLTLVKFDVPFFDITDTPNLHVGPVPKVKMAYPSGPSHQDVVNSLIAKLDIDRYKEDLTYLSQNFYTRYYKSETGIQSANWMFEKVKSYSNNRTDITIAQFGHSAYDQKSLTARFAGKRDGPLSILGAHQDSINVNNPAGGRSPGADDDGSGTISLLEIFRVLAENNFVPEYPLEFQWYAAEEVGLLGSQDIANAYKQQGVAVYGMFQLDMTGYTEPGLQAKVLNDYVDASLSQYVITILEEYTTLTHKLHNCGYGCSDHASYNRAGYPSSSVFEPKTNPRIHQSDDDLPLINWDQAYEFLKLGTGVAVEFSFGA